MFIDRLDAISETLEIGKIVDNYSRRFSRQSTNVISNASSLKKHTSQIHFCNQIFLRLVFIVYNF